MLIRNILTAIFFAIAMREVGAAEERPTLLPALSSCGQEFFSALHAKREVLGKIVPIRDGRGNRTYIKVPDRSGELGNTVPFSAPYPDGSLSLVGYFDDILDLAVGGRYYSWGFFVQGTIEEVKRQIAPALREGTHLRRDGDVYVRSELWKDGAWLPDDNLAGGVAPAHGTIERVFLIENGGPPEFPGVVRVGCSLQGSVTSEMVHAARPDISVDTEPFDISPRAAARELASLLFFESATEEYRKSLTVWREADGWNDRMLRCMQEIDGTVLSNEVAVLLEDDLTPKELTDGLSFMRTDTAARVMKQLRAAQRKGESVSRSDLDLSAEDTVVLTKNSEIMRKIVARMKSPRYGLAYVQAISATYERCRKGKPHRPSR
ncbi:hypothetical protein [Cupriavidus nantongensis]|uniref:hypothetical protein n=1 Tax=Cupriavidus nantongensis TaxID=1796606 RepID=UPI00358F4DB5